MLYNVTALKVVLGLAMDYIYICSKTLTSLDYVATFRMKLKCTFKENNIRKDNITSYPTLFILSIQENYKAVVFNSSRLNCFGYSIIDILASNLP